MVVTRRYHPLQGQKLTVLMPYKNSFLVRLEDGSKLRIPRAWTDADGTSHDVELAGDRVFTTSALRELSAVIESVTSCSDD